MTPGAPALRPEGEVEVLVVAFHAPELLDGCLTALEGRLPVVVVDNSSDPAVHAVARRHGAEYHDPGANLGFAGGVNVGRSLLHRPGADLLLLNPDAEISADGVARLHDCLHRTPRLACAAPAQTDPTHHESARVAWPFPTPMGAWAESLGLGRFRRGGQFMIGSILLVNAAALEEVGGFDERFFLYAEETDWQFRATRLGWENTLCTEVVASHVGAGTGGDRAQRDVRFHASTERYMRKHYGRRGWSVFRYGVMVGALGRALVLGGDRGRRAAARLRLYRTGPCRAEAALPVTVP
jgi:GT2 family glycosyltransferase